MAVLKILTYPDPRLRNKAKPIEKVDDSVRKLMDDMLETMYKDDAAGLASIQVGDERSVVVMHTDKDDPNAPYCMANLTFLSKSEEEVEMYDACMSVPDVYPKLYRPSEVEVQFLDYNNELRTMKASGRIARCLQHEYDHLQGVLNLDHLSPLKRKFFVKKYEKNQRLKQL